MTYLVTRVFVQELWSYLCAVMSDIDYRNRVAHGLEKVWFTFLHVSDCVDGKIRSS